MMSRSTYMAASERAIGRRIYPPPPWRDVFLRVLKRMREADEKSLDNSPSNAA